MLNDLKNIPKNRIDSVVAVVNGVGVVVGRCISERNDVIVVINLNIGQKQPYISFLRKNNNAIRLIRREIIIRNTQNKI